MDTRHDNCRRRYSTTCGWAIALLLSAFVAGCGGGGGDGGGTGGGSGTLGVSLTDAPACGFDAVSVTVSKVRVHQSGTASDSAGGWSDITLNPARKINLLDLTNGVLEYLGETALPAGYYTQVRLLLAPNNASSPFSNSVVLSSNPGAEIALRTPSAVQTGIKLVHGFNVAAGQRTDLVLDFDACKSVVTLGRGNGGYLLKPVIKVIPTGRNGINGFVDLNLVGSNVMVSAQMNGAVVRATSPDTSGAFFLARLAPGTYDVVITADESATVVIGSVPVDSTTSVVTISGQAAPILLPPSATRNISGNATLDPPVTEEVISVSAKQTFGGDLTVTVKSQAADPLSGDYTLTLPTGAPLLGHYLIGGTPPIPLEEQFGLAGQYAVEASADGYQTQSFDKNISAADATQDFVLIP